MTITATAARTISCPDAGCDGVIVNGTCDNCDRHLLDTLACQEQGEHLKNTRHVQSECPFASAAQIAERQAAHYDRALRIIGTYVAELNELLGYDTKLDEQARRECITFGYLGNDNDVLHYVFLPHPHRPGAPEDRIGGFRNGDWKGASTVAAQLSAMIRLTRNQAERLARR